MLIQYCTFNHFYSNRVAAEGEKVSKNYSNDHIPILSYNATAQVEKFVLFVGYRRSGHSIIGSMMDAHPDIVIAHEFFIFKKYIHKPGMLENMSHRYILFSLLYQDSYSDAVQGLRTMDHNAKGYSLQLNSSWQGRFRKLRVIGDKSGASTARMYFLFPNLFRKYYNELLKVVQVPLRVLHVVRNPYDIIATDVLYNAYKFATQYKSHGKKLPASTTNRYDNQTLLISKIKYLFENARAIVEMIREFNMTVLELHNEDLIADPKATLQSVCDFLHVECPADYLQQCYEKTYRSVSKTRDLIVWPKNIFERVGKEKQKYSFFNRYSFDK